MLELMDVPELGSARIAEAPTNPLMMFVGTHAWPEAAVVEAKCSASITTKPPDSTNAPKLLACVRSKPARTAVSAARNGALLRGSSAGFQTCCIADFQIG